MSYNFTLNNMSEFMCSSTLKEDYKINFPDNLGFMSCKKEIVTEDIFLFKTHALANKTLALQAISEVKGLVISIILDGKIHYKDNMNNQVETFKKNNLYIKYINEYDSTTIIDQNSSSKGIGIILRNDFLEKNFLNHFSHINDIKEKNSNKLPSLSIYRKDISKNLHLAKELYNSPFHGGLHNIYLQSKCLEIIYNEFNEILSCPKCNTKEKIKLSNEDIEALYKARDIILLTHEFPDLSTLAKKVAINEFKLKYGFKKLFSTSPGNMILEQKMLHAKQLLETSEYSIAEIANFVGYKYQQSFSNAFIHFFGLRPIDVIKTRNYYY
ncbi:transcriptional regulator, AraC family [Arcobacter nitrofigilis DSM 7299]|uniref:Transcriptional regulator, AraC family n=1 Tax=Arcobacter nitrofigilis (strain ATCC 33309 / DSM 7299 / CCUG 15893 / LMG 7604 / NCTC 12251 / CI) TaxID=572480 RepID=D5UZG2_ARCNC|nr:AraC family transcriptional regulator [Arcobacter nitrofigilis]ADG92199.1 transcriptional regulator, AraC family [Arcobacter nitrofigilis DSM 7299]